MFVYDKGCETMNEQKIPKIIHYCWFGGKEKPQIVKKCIESWNKHLPDYEIIEWNELSFDINSGNKFVKEAYKAKKFAFVSDYVRIYALYHYGGIYFDTDVEIYKSFNDLLHHESFWGFEQGNYIATSTIGVTKGNKIIQLFLDKYNDMSFIKDDGSFDEITNVSIITKILVNKGLEMNGRYQELEDLGTFYPQTYFSPYDYINCKRNITENTYAMHYFYKSWLSPKAKIKSQIKVIVAMVIGGENLAKLRKIVWRN